VQPLAERDTTRAHQRHRDRDDQSADHDETLALTRRPYDFG
jgi:hypothetical protein